MIEKCCKSCKILCTINQFGRWKYSADGYAHECRTCHNRRGQEYYQANKGIIRERQRLRYDSSKESKRFKAKYEKNYGYYAAKATARRQLKSQRMPSWLNNSDLWVIEQWYNAAKALSKELGAVFHVDHIVPLQGENVSGLHVPWNLQILPARENIIKGNKF